MKKGTYVAWNEWTKNMDYRDSDKLQRNSHVTDGPRRIDEHYDERRKSWLPRDSWFVGSRINDFWQLQYSMSAYNMYVPAPSQLGRFGNAFYNNIWLLCLTSSQNPHGSEHDRAIQTLRSKGRASFLCLWVTPVEHSLLLSENEWLLWNKLRSQTNSSKNTCSHVLFLRLIRFVWEENLDPVNKYRITHCFTWL